jgi:hypothetical protein
MVTATAAVFAALVLGLGLSLYLFAKERAALRLEKAALARAVAAEHEQALLREPAEKGLAIERRMREIEPLGAKFNQAGMLLSQGLFDKAEDLMKDVPLIVPASCSLFNVIGNHHAWESEWLAAITNFDRSVRVAPTNQTGFHLLAPLLVWVGRTESYETLRGQMLERFGGTRDANEAERLAKDYMILPPPAGSFTRLANLADTAVAAGSGNSDWPYFQFVKGLFEYRRGNFSQAIEPLQSVISQGGVAARTVQAYCVLAMAQYKLGQKDAAAESVASGRELAREKLDSFKAIDWNDRIIAQVLLREAGALVDSSNAKPQSP